MPAISEKLTRWLLVVAALLMVPNTFYWGSRDYYGGFGNVNNVFSDQYTSVSATAYLLIFFAICSRNLRFRAVLTYGAFCANIYYWFDLANAFRNSDMSMVDQLRALFINSPGHAPLAASQTLAVFLLGVLSYAQLEKFVTFFMVLRAFFTDSAHRLHSIIWAILTALSIAGLIFGTGLTIWNEWGYRGLSGNIYMSFIQVFALIFAVGADLLLWSVLLWASIHWVSHIQQLIDDLRDFKINQYITRKLGGYIYTGYSVGIVAFAALAVPAAAMGDFLPNTEYGARFIDWLIFPIYFIGGIAGTFLVLIIWRIIVEFTVSLIHIAENTRKN